LGGYWSSDFRVKEALKNAGRVLICGAEAS
jgi:hypothetical protein